MATDLVGVSLQWMIGLARDGDGELLADLLRGNEPIQPVLREFLADVVAGKIKLKPPKKLTYKAASQRWLREKMVVRAVDVMMGKRRDTKLRTYWIDKCCKLYDTNPNAVAAFIKYGRTAKRRRSQRK